MSVNIIRLMNLSKLTISGWSQRSKYLAYYESRRSVQEFPGLRYDNTPPKDYLLVLPEALNENRNNNELLRIPKKGEPETDFTKLNPEVAYKGLSQTICNFENFLTDMENEGLSIGITTEEVVQMIQEKLYPMDSAFNLFMVLSNIDSSQYHHTEFYELIQRFYTARDRRRQGIFREAIELDVAKRQSQLSPVEKRMMSVFHIGDVKRPDIRVMDYGTIFHFREDLNKDVTLYMRNYNEANQLFSHTVDDPDILSVVSNEFDDCQGLHHKERTPLQITIDTYHRFMQVCPDRFVRQMLWQTYNKRCSPKSQPRLNNLTLIGGIRVTRRKISDIMGYRSYVEFKMRDTTADSKAEILESLKMLNEENRPKLDDRLQELNDFAADNNFDDPYQLGIQEYDVDFWSHKYIHDILIGVKETDLRTYFPLNAVLNGVQTFFKNYFDIEISSVHEHKDKFWSGDVHLFEVKRDGDLLGNIIYDPYETSNKSVSHVFYARVRSRYNDHLPCRFLSTSYKRDNETNKAYLSQTDIKDLFHSFGILVQRLLYRYRYYELNTYGGLERDSMHLLPNLCNAYFLSDHKILQSCSDRGQSRTIDSELARRMLSANAHFRPFKTYNELYKAHLDLEIHSVLAETKDIAREVYQTYSPFRRDPDNFDFCSMAEIIAGPNDGIQYANLRSKQLANFCLGQITASKGSATPTINLESNKKLIDRLFDPEKLDTKEKLVSLFGQTFESSKTGLGVL